MTKYEKFLQQKLYLIEVLAIQNYQQNLAKQIIEVCSGGPSKINKMVEIMRGIENE